MLLMMCCWNGKQPVCNTWWFAQKFMGCSRSNQHSLGWWSGLRRAKHFSKCPGPRGFCYRFRDGKQPFKKFWPWAGLRDFLKCCLSASACVGAGLFCIVCLWDKTYL